MSFFSIVVPVPPILGAVADGLQYAELALRALHRLGGLGVNASPKSRER